MAPGPALAAAGLRAGAVVVDNQQEARGDSVVFRPVVQFRTSVGQEVRAVVETVVSNRSHLTGLPMEIIYDPAAPQHVTRPGDRTGGGIGAIVAGLIFLGFAVLAFAFALTALHVFDDPGPGPDTW